MIQIYKYMYMNTHGRGGMPHKTGHPGGYCLCVSSCVRTYMHALTLSASAAFAPSARSAATVPARPFSLALCNAERLYEPSCEGTYTQTSVPCPPHAPPPCC